MDGKALGALIVWMGKGNALQGALVARQGGLWPPELVGLTFEDYEAASGHSTAPPASGNEAKARIDRPDVCRTDLGVVPATRPSMISDGVSLSHKLGREVRTLVAEECAFDAVLRWDRVIDVVSPHKDSVAGVGSKNDACAWSDELALPRRFVSRRIVPPVERKAGSIAILGQKPQRRGHPITAPRQHASQTHPGRSAGNAWCCR